MTDTLYEPTGKFANRYSPLELVVVVVTALPNTSVTEEPSAFVMVNVTPARPGSPESLMPFRFVSDHTTLPTDTFGDTKPKSSVMSLAPSVVKFEDVASPVDESTARSLPANATVGTYPAGSATDTLYEPTGKFANTYAPLVSVVVVVTAAPNTLVTGEPSAFVIVNVTPEIPGSPESCTPSLSMSNHTKFPTLTFGTTKPKSRD